MNVEENNKKLQACFNISSNQIWQCDVVGRPDYSITKCFPTYIAESSRVKVIVFVRNCEFVLFIVQPIVVLNY